MADNENDLLNLPENKNPDINVTGEDNQQKQLIGRLATIEKFRDEDYKGSENRKIIIDSLVKKGSLEEVAKITDDVNFKEAIDKELKTYMDAQVEIIKDEIIRSLKLTEVEAGEKVSAMTSNSGLAVIKDLSDAAESKESDVNFASNVFLIKLGEAVDKHQNDINFDKSKISGQIMTDITEQLQGKHQEERDRKFIDIASNSKEMDSIVNSAIKTVNSKTEEAQINNSKKDKKQNFLLNDSLKEELENKSKQISESINTYLEAKEEKEKAEAKQCLLTLLDPEQESSKHSTFKLLATTTRDVLDDAKMGDVKGLDEILHSLGDEFSNLSNKENKKDSKGYEEVVENISRNCAVIDKKFNQQENGLTKRLINTLSESLEENKEDLEDKGSNLKKNCAKIFKVAGFATLAAVGGPFGIIAGLLFIYLFRNLGEGKNQEQIEKDEEFERNKQELMAARMATASRSMEKPEFSKTEGINEEIAKKAKEDLESAEDNLKENKKNLEIQNVESEKSSKENAETFKKIKENINELNKENNPMLKKFSKDDSIQEKKSKSFVEFALQEKVARKSHEI